MALVMAFSFFSFAVLVLHLKVSNTFAVVMIHATRNICWMNS